jgi:hypothetical protein
MSAPTRGDLFGSVLLGREHEHLDRLALPRLLPSCCDGKNAGTLAKSPIFVTSLRMRDPGLAG